MQSKNRLPIQNYSKRSFIEESRRAQIIEATINTLAKYGYTNASFVRIGKEAGITPSLIGYHFDNKEELMQTTLHAILAERAAHVKAKLTDISSAGDKLRIAIEADLDHMTTNIYKFKALAEIIFTIRSEEGALTYLSEKETDLFNLTHRILEEGKRSGEFINVDTHSMAIIIDGARDSFLAQFGLRHNFNVDQFKATLIDTIMTIIKKG